MRRIHWRWLIAAIITALLGLSVSGSSQTQAVAAGTVVLPPNYDATKSYGVVELLMSDSLFQHYLFEVSPDALDLPPEGQFAALLTGLFPKGVPAGQEFILILGGAGSADYRTADAWNGTISRFETRVLADLAAVSKAHRVDATRVVVAGFSVGADLAWALTLRNPTKLRGAVLMSSRASYRLSTGYAALTQGSRFYLTIGGKEDASRVAGARAAAALLKGAKVPSLYCETKAQQHTAAPPEVFAEALSFVLAPRSTPVPARAISAACAGK